jgi:glutaryl-CoA dehydrogenase
MARTDKLGDFALTEPEHGSDFVSLETSARPDGDTYVLNGAKRWIGLGTVADVVVVWARDTDDGKVNGFLVDPASAGFEADVIEGKAALRAVWQADIALSACASPRRAGSPGPTASRTRPRCCARPDRPADGRRWATPSPPTTRR